MKNIKRLAALTLALFSVFILLCSCGVKKYKNIPDPSDAFYVYDEADVLYSELEEYIIGKNADLYKKCGGQIVVACVNTTGDYDIADYARDMFNKWGVGSSERNNGILMLLSIEEDDYWVLQGKGLEDLIQSSTLKLMLDRDLEPFFAKKAYADGVLSLFDVLIEEFEQIYNISVQELPASSVGTYTPEPSDMPLSVSDMSLWDIISLVSTFIVGFTIAAIILIIIIVIVITVFIIIASVVNAGLGSPFRGGINVNPHSYRPSGTYRRGGSFNYGGSHHSGGFNFGGGSHRSGGSFGGGSHRSGGFSGGSHHSGGGGFSRGGGAGRR